MALERLYEPLTESGYYILLCLSLGDSYGYEIMNRVQELSGGLVTIGPGTMYGALSNMIRKGWIFEAGHKGKRRIYRLAKQGGEVLGQEVQRLETMVSCARAIRGMSERTAGAAGSAGDLQDRVSPGDDSGCKAFGLDKK